MSNRLAGETSPYLQQHRDNPVDWYPWGDEALKLARQEDRPILLSIGYSACHWCHVMERESFEDPAVAELMNGSFVPIKVDREERPDLDAVYMEAVQAMTGHGGWPMTVFLTPDGVPFYGGTYFPPEDRHGLPSFSRLLGAVAETWRDRRAEVEAQGAELVEHIGGLSRLAPAAGSLSADPLEVAKRELTASFDEVHGGFGGAPKFPQPMTVDLALRFARRGDESLGKVAAHTLDRMAAGGMYDQLGGGFARYSVDRAWIVPHFEKMLYDNAQLLRTYARSYLATGSPRHLEVARATAAWMLREMRDPAGGFMSSIDADSEGVEGRFYVWSLEEVREVTGPDFDAAVAHFGFTEEGNFEGANIPVYAGEPADPAAIERARTALLARRAERVRPATDAKVLTAWNGLAASALASAGAALDPTWVDAAAEAMDFVLSALRRKGRLMRSYRDGIVKHHGFAEDYAYCLEACLALYEASSQVRWLESARSLADDAIELFHDTDKGGFFTTGSDSERLIARAKDLIDNAVPATNSVFALELQRLALVTGNDRYQAIAEEVLRLVAPIAQRSPLAFGHALGALDHHLSEPLEIVIVGRRGEPDTEALVEVIVRRSLPNSMLVVHPTGDPAISPLLEGRTQIDGRATAFVCRNRVCDVPVDTPEALAQQLNP